MHIHGIIPPVATPMQANEDLDLPRLAVVPRPPHRQRGPRRLRPGHQQRVLRPGRARKARGDRHGGGPRQQARAGLRRHRGRDDARGRAPDEDGRARRGRRRLGHHAVLHQPHPAGDLRPLPPHRRGHVAAGGPVQQPRRPAAASRSTWTRWPGWPRSPTSSASRIPAATCRTPTNTSAWCRTVSPCCMGRDTLIYPEPDLRGARGGAGHRPTSRRPCVWRSTRRSSAAITRRRRRRSCG